MNPIYLDYNATTPVIPEVLEAMQSCQAETFGNPSSAHAPGRAARVKLDEARERVAALIGARPGEIVFTSGGTESDNLAIAGVAWGLQSRGNHIVTSRVEHPAVLNTCRELERRGFQVDYLPVDGRGRVDPDQVLEAVTDKTLLVSLQHGNSEVGTLQPLEPIGSRLRERGVLFHTDAVQSVGKLPVSVDHLPVDLLSFSAHKMYGPKGVGALYVRRGTPPLAPLVSGGGQEKKRRAGTENLAGIVGFGAAAEWVSVSLDGAAAAMRALKDELRAGIASGIEGVVFHGHPEECLPNTLCLGFDGVDGQSLMIRLDLAKIYVSTGTACSSGAVEPSETLTAMGLDEAASGCAVRLSLGRLTTREDIRRVIAVLIETVGEIRTRGGPKR